MTARWRWRGSAAAGLPSARPVAPEPEAEPAEASVEHAELPHLRRVPPEVLALLHKLRAGTVTPPKLPLGPVSAEANRVWKVEIDIVQGWARQVRLGGRRHRCPEVEGWSRATLIRYGVLDAWEETSP